MYIRSKSRDRGSIPKMREMERNSVPDSQIDLHLPIILLFFPYIELVFWRIKQPVHTGLLLIIFLVLLANFHKKKERNLLQKTLVYGFSLYFLFLSFYNLLNSTSVDRSTWSVFIVGAFFINSLNVSRADENFYILHLKELRTGLKFTLLLHVLIFVISNNAYSNLTTVEINPIPLFAISLAFAFYSRDRILLFLSLIAIAANFLYNPQLSHIFILLTFGLAYLFRSFKPKIGSVVYALAIVSYLTASKFFLKSLLTEMMHFTSKDIQIRLDMNNYAQQIINSNLLMGGHLAAPLTLLVMRGRFTTQLPFHSDILTWLVAGGAIGLFLYLSNLLLTFYRVPVGEAHHIIIKSSCLGLVCCLFTGLINPIFPGYILFFCLSVCFT